MTAMLRSLFLALAAICVVSAAPAAVAAEDAEAPEPHAFSFEGPFGVYDMQAVQRGFLVYKQVCSTCHSMNHLSYRNLGEPGGPFAAYDVRDEKTGEKHIRIGLPPGEHGELVGINDNPFVRQIASEATVTDIDRDTGLETDRPARVSDHFRKPFANEFVARAANGGALPPDLSVITLARAGGAAYVRSILTGFVDPPPAGVEVVEAKHYNRYFPGHWISMAPPLSDDVVEFADGTPATVEQMATDVATFLQWAADPHMEARKRLGLEVLAFLLVLTALSYVAYKQVWRGTKH
jgi:ubiquinol-cytochrome c reductase cytochrome c1 subunit